MKKKKRDKNGGSSDRPLANGKQTKHKRFHVKQPNPNVHTMKTMKHEQSVLRQRGGIERGTMEGYRGGDTERRK